MNTATISPPVSGLIQGLAWVGNDLIAVDEDIVDDRIRRKALSASTSKSMKGCLAKYAGEKLLPREKDPFSVSELGTSTHAIIEDLYNMPAADRTLDAFHNLKDEHAEKQWSLEKLALEDGDGDISSWEAMKLEWKGEVVRLGARVFEIENPAEQTTYKTELPFDGVKIAGGVPAMGYIDRVDVIVVREKNRYKVIDLKTGKMKSAYDLRRFGDDHGDQIRVYADAIKEVTGEAPAIGSIHYTQFGVEREIPMTELAMETTRKSFRSAWDTHNIVTDSGVFPTQVGPLCGWCPLVNSCPAAKAAGKKASDKLKDVPPTAVQLGIPTLRVTGKPMGSKLPVTDPVIAPIPASKVMASISGAAIAETVPPVTEAPVDPYAAVPAIPAPLGPIVVLAAHAFRDTSDNNGIGNPTVTTSTTPARLFSEGKPWEATINGLLNGASYSAMAVVSVPQIAGELLVAAGRPLNGPTLDRLTDLLATIIIDVQKSVRAGEFDWSDGINTRIRGALRTTIETLPLPWDATTEEAWAAWQVKATKRTTIFITKAVRLFNAGDVIAPAPFAALLPSAVASIAAVPGPGASKVA